MKVVIPLVIVVVLFMLGWFGASVGLPWVVGVFIPYFAIAVFLIGIIVRVMSWANIPVPFRIPTTCGQQKSLSWIKNNAWDNPHNGITTVGRMVLEILFFRSLLRNTKTHMTSDRRLIYSTELSLWLAALVMHWAFLIILIRHVRFVMNPVPWCVSFLEKTDGFFELGIPTFYTSTILFLAALAFLLLRRLFNAQNRYISLINDYFPLFLLLAIGLSGLWLRHFTKSDVAGIKELAMGLVTFSPTVPDTINPLFFGHLFLVSIFLAYFPFSKLVHMAGVFLSPTRNMANSNRRVRHVNPWDYPVKVHPYDEYEDELRDKMKAAGIPVEKQ